MSNVLPKIGATFLSSIILATTFSASPASASNASNVIDTSDREAVVQAFKTRYMPALSTPIEWTGDVSTCNAGTQSAASLVKGKDVINLYRGLAGLGSIELNSTYNAQAQQAALMMHANGQLNHYPDTTWKCHSAIGDVTAGQSNLFGGVNYNMHNAASAIDVYMDDPGAGNTSAGHRRWIFEPGTTSMGLGTTSSFNALKVIGTTSSTAAPNPMWITFPSEGYFPQQLIPRTSNRWSISSDKGVNFTNAQVTVKDSNGVSLPVKKLPVTTGAGPNTLVFEVDGIIENDGGTGQKAYTVKVTNMLKGTETVSYTYTTRLIDGIADRATYGGTQPSIKSVSDIVAIDKAGVLWNYGNRSTARTQIGTGWSNAKEIHVTDWDNDKVADIIEQRKDGLLVFHQGNPEGGFTAKQIGAGWGSFETTVAKWKTNDTFPSIIAKNTSTGELFVYGNANGSTITSKTKIGSGWGALSVNIADWDKNGNPDILAKNSAGQILLYRTNGKGAFLSETRKVIGSGWNVMNKMTVITNYGGYGNVGMMARDTNGNLYYYTINTGAWGAKTSLGAGWGTYTIAKH